MELIQSTKPEVVLSFFDDEAELLLANEKLLRLLTEAVISVNVSGRLCLVYLLANKAISIELFDFGIYRITLSDESLYLDGETSESKLSQDRVLYYLEYIANVALMDELQIRNLLKRLKNESNST